MKMNLIRKKWTYKLLAVIMVITMIMELGIIYNGEKAEAATDAFEQSISGFPDSYKGYLRTLHTKYPNWKFVPYNTGINFATAVSKEYENNKSLIENAYSKYLKSNATSDYNVSTGTYIAKDGGSWVSASKNCIAYFMDPRNFLDDTHIYMFEQLSYDKNAQTQAGVEAILQGSFMYNTNINYISTAGKYTTSNIKYSKQIMDAAKAANVSAYYIASKILQEVGTRKNDTYAGMGASGSVSGTYSTKYTGIYNFYNIGASSSANPILNGLFWASSGSTYERPWNTPFKSILGGAKYIGEKYINCGQNTIYFQRFNVNKNSTYSLYTHQYMTNIYGAASEASYTSDAYNSLGIAGLAKTFVIPVFTSLPNQSNQVKLGNSTSKTGTVSSSVNMRKGPGTENENIITLSKGDAVTVTGGVMTTASFGTRWLSNPYWYKISVNKSGKNYTGYVSAAYINLNREYNMAKGSTLKLPITLSSSETVYYMSDNPAIATVDASGNVSGKGNGTVTIRVFTSGGNMSATGVQVFENGVSLDLSNVTLSVGQKKSLKTTIYPSNATNKNVKYSSSNKSVAKVSAKGKITAKSPGSAVITATAAIGGVAATCRVTVVPEKVTLTGKSKNYNTVKLSWNKSANASAYWIYKKNSAGKYKLLAKVSGDKDSYLDKNLTTGQSYSYKIKTVKKVSGTNYKSAKSSAVSVIPVPGKVKITSIKANKSGAVLQWKAVAGANGYKIYRSGTKKGNYKCIKTIKKSTKLKYTNTGLSAGKRYYYKVVAYKTVNGKTVYGKYSKKVVVKK